MQKEHIDNSILDKLDLMIANKLASAGLCSGTVFKIMRRSLGLAAIDLAELLDIAPETISRWENGKRGVDRATIITLGALVSDALHDRTDTMSRLRALRQPAQLEKTVKFDLTV